MLVDRTVLEQGGYSPIRRVLAPHYARRHWPGVREELFEITKIWEIDSNKSKPTTMTHVYNESANLIEGYAVHLDING